MTGVELWHRACFAIRDTPRESTAIAVTAPIVPQPPAAKRSKRWFFGSVGAASAVTVGLISWSWATPSVAAGIASVDIDPGEVVAVHASVAAREQRPARTAWVATAIEAKYAVPVNASGVPLDEQFPSLRTWTHPVTHSPELVPTQASRLFGVERIGIERAECGSGHCGIDLDGPRGRALVAVADGTIVRVERSELGADKRSGRYVRIAHEDGTLTSYMHMDDVADGLESGSRVRAGQYVGTLGATAVYAAPPHLHFSLEIPTHPGPRRGDITDTRFVDPAPFLARSTIIALPSDLDDALEKPDPKDPKTKRHVIKPAF